MTSESRRLKVVYLAGPYLLFSAKFFYEAYLYLPLDDGGGAPDGRGTG
jgi:hypothetical protein